MEEDITGLQAFVDTYDHQLEEASCLRGRVSGSYNISLAHWFVEVYGQHQAIYLFYREHFEPVHCGPLDILLDFHKTCVEELV